MGLVQELSEWMVHIEREINEIMFKLRSGKHHLGQNKLAMERN